MPNLNQQQRERTVFYTTRWDAIVVGPQLQLMLVGERRVSHDQPTCRCAFAGTGGVGALGDFGLTVAGYSIAVHASFGIDVMALLVPLLEHLTAIV